MRDEAVVEQDPWVSELFRGQIAAEPLSYLDQ